MPTKPSSYKEVQEKRQREKKVKELYTRYNQCRDAELDRFWKNSVFVWVFLALCFSALGVLIFDHYTKYGLWLLRKGLEDDDYYYFSLIVSVVGLVLSNIWVWMAQGLKAWYEVFENVIWKMETYDNVFEYPKEYTINNYWTIKDTKNSIQKLFVSAAPISSSRIVILIGRLLVVFWSVIFILYLSIYCKLCIWNCNDFENCYNYLEQNILKTLWQAFNFKFWSILILIFTIVFICKILIQSSTLNTDEENDFIANISTLLQSKIKDTQLWNIVYFSNVLKPFINKKNISINHNTLFRRCILSTSIDYYRILVINNARVKCFNDFLSNELLLFMKKALEKHSNTGCYIIRKVKLVKSTDKIKFKIKCRFSLWRYINQLTENYLRFSIRCDSKTINY